MNYNLVKANIDNQELLIKYKLNSIIDYATNLSEEEINKINNYVKTNIPKQISNYKLIIVNDNIIGCLLVEKYKDGILLDEIYIESNFRNLGIGSSIIENIIKDKKIIYLWVYKNNVKAIKLYLKLKFKIEEETETRYFMKRN